MRADSGHAAVRVGCRLTVVDKLSSECLLMSVLGKGRAVFSGFLFQFLTSVQHPAHAGLRVSHSCVFPCAMMFLLAPSCASGVHPFPLFALLFVLIACRYLRLFSSARVCVVLCVPGRCLQLPCLLPL